MSKYQEMLGAIEASYFNILQEKSQAKKTNLIAELRDQFREVIEELPAKSQARHFFGNQIDSVPLCTNELIAITVIKDESYIELLASKISSLLFDKLIIIDDRSRETPKVRSLASNQVSILRVINGYFGLAKTLWIESICNTFFNNCWVATLDADEFIEADTFYEYAPSLRNAVSQKECLKHLLSASTFPVAPFCLLDIIPKSPLQDHRLLSKSKLLYFASPPLKKELRDYKCHAAVKWSFGSECYSQCMTDIRSHLFGITESRSKFSLIFWNSTSSIKLHQGFHSVVFRKGSICYDMKWAREKNIKVSTILHGKILFSIIDTAEESKIAEYFPRTADNIRKLNSGINCISDRLLESKMKLQPYRGSIFMPSWVKMGKIFLSEKHEKMLETFSSAIHEVYEVNVISHALFEKLLRNLNEFKAMKIVRVDRRSGYLQMINRVASKDSAT